MRQLYLKVGMFDASRAPSMLSINATETLLGLLWENAVSPLKSIDNGKYSTETNGNGLTNQARLKFRPALVLMLNACRRLGALFTSGMVLGLLPVFRIYPVDRLNPFLYTGLK